VVDLCAGAGGKTLALAAAMEGQGRLIACDVDRARLSRLSPRAERAGAAFIETRLLDGGREARALGDLEGQADIVLIDAPCSGTGTWRRNPEARWRLTPDRLERLRAMQAHVLDFGAPLVKPGGRLVYAVCSLLDEEGSDRIAAFLAANPGWTPAESIAAGRPRGAGRRLTPAHDRTDGFLIAALVRSC
jgi:16S rRNA (cytosine967-C5)-methyltransferase